MTSPRMILAMLLATSAVPALAQTAAEAREPEQKQESSRSDWAPPEQSVRRRDPVAPHTSSAAPVRRPPAPPPGSAPGSTSAQPQAAKRKASGPVKSGDDDDISDLDVERRTARKAVQPGSTKQADLKVKTVPRFDEPPPPPTGKASADKKDHPKPSARSM